MQWIMNLKTATKIFLLIGVAVIFLTGVGFVGYHYASKMSNDMHEMYSNYLLSVKWLNASRGQTRAVEALTLELMHPGTPKAKEQELLRESDKRIAEVDKLLGDYEKTALDKFEEQKYQIVKENLKTYRVERAKAIEIALIGQKADAFVYFTQNAAPRMDTVNAVLKELADHNAENAEKADKQGQEDAAFAIKMMITMTILAIALTMLFGRIIGRIISKPLNEMLSEVQEVANGNLGVKAISAKSADEVGQLGIAFNAMVTNLRSLVCQVAQSAEQVAASSEELTASAEQSAQAANQVAITISGVANGAELQLQAVNGAISVVDQMSAGVRQVVSNSDLATSMADKTSAAAHEGGKAVDLAITKMSDIEKTVNHSAEVVSELGSRSKEIGQIVDTISGIAGQTNLLALNAAIEAARAGEQGRGFAVVAEEVRKLAEQSQDAAKQIATLINSIQGDTEKAVTSMLDGTREVKVGAEVVNSAGQSFREIVGLVDQVTKQIREISTAIRQVANGSEQIVSCVREIDKISRGTAAETQTVSAATEEQSASMEEIASSSEALSNLAQGLQQAVNRFQV